MDFSGEWTWTEVDFSGEWTWTEVDFSGRWAHVHNVHRVHNVHSFVGFRQPRMLGATACRHSKYQRRTDTNIYPGKYCIQAKSSYVFQRSPAAHEDESPRRRQPDRWVCHGQMLSSYHNIMMPTIHIQLGHPNSF